MKNSQTPIVKIGTKLPHIGIVVAILSDAVVIKTGKGELPFTFKQVEDLIP
jgi:hypothetical protein